MLLYVRRSALDPVEKKDPTVIAHVCNDRGVWGAGFATAISKKWTAPQFMYLAEYANEIPPKLGEVIWTPVEYGVLVANMVAQQGVTPKGTGLPLVNYHYLKRALGRVAELAKKSNAAVQMPRIGCGLGGGEWRIVEDIINEKLVRRGVRTYVCDLPNEAHKWPTTKYAL